MIAIKARIENGYLKSVGPVDLPEGAELDIIAETHAMTESEQMTEVNWPTTPEGIAQLLARMDSRESLALSDDEIAQWELARRADKEWELAHADERDEHLRKIWE